MKKQTFLRLFTTISILTLTSFIALCQSLTYPIVDTDVHDFYDNITIISALMIGQAFYGQDATYSGNQPSYTDNGDGSITDNVTGLMWQQEMGSKISYSDAFIKANIMTLGGYSDWRVPTIKELYSLILFTGQVSNTQAISMFIDTNYFQQPIGNIITGEREIDAQTWSSTQYAGLTMGADTTVFGVNFVDGRIKGYPKYQPPVGTVPMTMYFRMVRGNTSYGINDFIDNEDGTITDITTGLMWQQADDGTSRDWENALSYAENLMLAENSDWRLPNAKELQSIVDYTRSPQTSNSPAIDQIFSTTEINDPNGNPGQYPYFWTGTSHLDGANPYSGAVYIAFGEAQGKMNGTLMDVHGAGAQRSDPKSGNASDYPDFHGPQGDVRYVYNSVRCVRDVSVTNSINESKNIDINFKVYPNPAQDKIAISSGFEMRTIYIYNSIGERLMNLTPKQKDIFINTSHLPNGIYFINVRSDRSMNTFRKVIISR